ncbi:hypothetical protein FJZ26_02315 [Candidatus Parvarchaeota archaeon]|nr:hypothetical protein [Candidatus Parvarchaeota archaeon]
MAKLLVQERNKIRDPVEGAKSQRRAFEGLEANQHFKLLLPYADEYSGKANGKPYPSAELSRIARTEENEDKINSAIYTMAMRGDWQWVSYIAKHIGGRAGKMARVSLLQGLDSLIADRYYEMIGLVAFYEKGTADGGRALEFLIKEYEESRYAKALVLVGLDAAKNGGMLNRKNPEAKWEYEEH